jgi:hypothetical protein
MAGVRNVISMPDPFALVRLSGFDGAINGDWAYEGNGEVILQTQDYSVHKLNLVRFDSISSKQLSTLKYSS